jgi:hypothetical protein
MGPLVTLSTCEHQIPQTFGFWESSTSICFRPHVTKSKNSPLCQSWRLVKSRGFLNATSSYLLLLWLSISCSHWTGELSISMTAITGMRLLKISVANGGPPKSHDKSLLLSFHGPSGQRGLHFHSHTRPAAVIPVLVAALRELVSQMRQSEDIPVPHRLILGVSRLYNLPTHGIVRNMSHPCVYNILALDHPQRSKTARIRVIFHHSTTTDQDISKEIPSCILCTIILVNSLQKSHQKMEKWPLVETSKMQIAWWHTVRSLFSRTWPFRHI